MANSNTYWRSPDLGTPREIDVSGGRMRVFESGSGPAIVFVHGLLVNANLWRKVVPRLSSSHRCITLDMPLGGHELAMPQADLTPTGLADLVADAIEALGLEDVTLVGNDTGGGLCQLVITRNPDRVGRLFLTSCDAFENFPPTFFKVILAPIALPPVVPVLFAPLRIRALRSLPIAFGWLMHSRLEPEAGDSYIRPTLTNSTVRKDVARVLRGIKPSFTIEAAKRFGEFEKPVRIAWSKDDRFFPLEHADRLAERFPNASVELIENSRTFSPEDQPERLAGLISAFVREPAAAAA